MIKRLLTALLLLAGTVSAQTLTIWITPARRGNLDAEQENTSLTGLSLAAQKTMEDRMRKWICLAFLLCITSSLFAQSAGPTYYYVATTVDVNGFESTFSNQVTATFTQGKHIAALSWTAAVVPTGGAAIAGYNIYRGTVAGGPYTKINTSLVTGVTYADTFVPPNAPSGLTVVTQ